MNNFNDWYFEQRYLGIEPIDHARAAFEAGQQSKQKEIDELNLTIKRLIASEEDIARGCKHWRDSHRELDERLDKVLDALCESGKTKEYRIEHAICLLKGEKFVW